MNYRSKTCLRKGQRGLAVVESVIAMPVVIVIMIAVAELGNAILQYNALTQFARDGARFAAVAASPGSTGTINLTPAAIAEIQNLVVYGQTSGGPALIQGLGPSDVQVTNLGDGNISVAVSFQYQPLLVGGIPNLIGAGQIGGAFTMNAEVIMRVLT